MRTILEKALIAALDERHEEADRLFHRFVVGRSRQIHEAIRHGDQSVLDESWNGDLSEEYFTEDDLNGLEDDQADLENDATTDMEDESDDLDAAEIDASDADADDAAADDLSDDIGDDAGDDMGDDMGDDADVSPEALDNIRNELEQLMADFDKVLNGDSDGDVDGSFGDDDGDGSDMGDTDSDMADDLPADDGSDADMDDTSNAPDMDNMDEPMEDDDMSMGGDDEMDEGEESEFDGLIESITSDLEKITADLDTDGKELGGKTIEQNRKSSVGGTKADASKAAPIKMKSVDHTGYEREPSPGVKDINAGMMKKPRNVNAKADAGRSTVSKEGDKAALLNKDFASGGK